jgi:hypothetical protein
LPASAPTWTVSLETAYGRSTAQSRENVLGTFRHQLIELHAGDAPATAKMPAIIAAHQWLSAGVFLLQIFVSS